MFGVLTNFDGSLFRIIQERIKVAKANQPDVLDALPILLSGQERLKNKG